MKFVLREYLVLLKEDKELDSIVSDLLFNIGVIPITKPQRGRQYGVDIAAVGRDIETGKRKLYLMVIKQGDFSRTVWDNGINSIRPTLNEIQDSYIPTHIPRQFASLPKKIVVCCNGELHQTMNLTWSSYTRKHQKKKLEFEFWGIDKLVDLLINYSISEQMLPEKDRLLLRKTLAFADVPDYDLRHFYELIDNILQRGSRTTKTIIRKARLCALCLNIIRKWSEENNNLKPTVIAAERLLMKIWDWMRKEGHLEDPHIIQEVYKLHFEKLQIGRAYFRKIQKHCYVKDGLFSNTRTHLEYALVTWEQLGLIAVAGLTEVWEATTRKLAKGEQADIKTYQANALSISDGLMHLIQNNPPASTPKYDEHVIEVTLVALLLIHTDNSEFLSQWLKKIAENLIDGYRYTKFFPLFHTSYDKLLSVQVGEEKSEVTSSILLTILAEWAAILQDENLYNLIQKASKGIFKEVDLQLWFPEKETEDQFYSRDALKETGSTKHSIELPEGYRDYVVEMIEERKLFAVESEMSIFRKGMYYLGFLACRHFRTYPLPIFWRAFAEQSSDASKPT